MKSASSDRRPIHHSPIFWIGIALCLAAIAIYLWSDDLSWRPAPIRLKLGDYRLTQFSYWHELDLQRCPPFGRYRGKTGHGADSPIRSRMTLAV